VPLLVLIFNSIKSVQNESDFSLKTKGYGIPEDLDEGTLYNQGLLFISRGDQHERITWVLAKAGLTEALLHRL
jgi:hypothetical protein